MFRRYGMAFYRRRICIVAVVFHQHGQRQKRILKQILVSKVLNVRRSSILTITSQAILRLSGAPKKRNIEVEWIR